MSNLLRGIRRRDEVENRPKVPRAARTTKFTATGTKLGKFRRQMMRVTLVS
jgi:hypothetical protein